MTAFPHHMTSMRLVLPLSVALLLLTAATGDSTADSTLDSTVDSAADSSTGSTADATTGHITLDESLRLATEYRKQGRYQEAEELYHTILERFPDSPDAHNGLGFMYSTLGDYDRAIESLQQAARLRPGWARPLYHTGSCFTELKRYDEAERFLKQSLQLDPADASAHNALGILYARRSINDRAVQAYKKAAELRPGWIAPHWNLVLLYDSQGLCRESDRHLKKLLEYDPENRNALYKMVEHIAGGGGGQWETAQSYAGRLVASHPDWPASHEAMGIVLVALNRLDEAETSFMKALALDPDSAAARLGLGRIRMQQGRYAQSETEYRKALDIDASLHEARQGIETAQHQSRQSAGGCSRATPSHGNFASLLYYLAVLVPAMLFRRRNRS